MTIPEQLRAMRGALKVSTLAKILGLSKVTIHRMVNRHAIPHIRVGNSIRFDPAVLADWLEGSQ